MKQQRMIGALGRLAATAGMAFGAGSVAVSGGCSSAPAVAEREKPPATGMRPPLSWANAIRPRTEILRAPGLTRRDFVKPQLMSSMTLRAPKAAPATGDGVITGEAAGEMILVQLATNEIAPAEVLRTLIGELLGRDFVLAPAVLAAKEMMTLDIDQEMSRPEVMNLVYGLSKAYGWIVVDEDGVLHVRPEAEMARALAPVIQARAAMPDDAPVVRVMRLRNLTVDAKNELFKDLLSPGGKLVVNGSTVFIIDRGRNVDRVARLLEIMDTPAFDGAEILTYRLGTLTGTQAAGALNAIIAAPQAGGMAPMVTFAAVGDTKRIVAISRDPAMRTQINDLVASVDQPMEGTDRFHFLYRIQYYDPDALNALLVNFLSEHIEVQAEKADPNSTKIRISHDAEARLMAFRCTLEEYEDILRILYAVDRPPAQVQLDTMIAEVQQTGRLEFGVESFLQGIEIGGVDLELSSTPGLPASPAASAFLVGTDGFVVLQMLESEGSVRILQRPNITAMDGAESSFQVGGEVPVVKGDIDTTVQQGGSTGIRREIEYRKTGVILEAQPQILESGMVILTLKLEITAVGAETDLGPEFTTRMYSSKVVVPHGATLILAGIIDDAVRNTRTQVPGLGDVPLIGDAFANVNDREARTELFMAITPTIVTDPMLHAQMTSEFLEAAGGVRALLAERMDDLPRGAGFVVPDEWGETPGPALGPEPQPELPPGIREMLEHYETENRPT